MKFQPFKVSLLTHTAQHNSRKVSRTRLGQHQAEHSVHQCIATVVWLQNSLYTAAMLFALPACSQYTSVELKQDSLHLALRSPPATLSRQYIGSSMYVSSVTTRLLRCDCAQTVCLDVGSVLLIELVSPRYEEQELSCVRILHEHLKHRQHTMVTKHMTSHKHSGSLAGVDVSNTCCFTQ